MAGTIRTRADGDEKAIGVDDLRLVGRDANFDPVGIEEAGFAHHAVHAVAGELMFQHVHFMIQGLVQAQQQVLGFQVLFDPVGAPVEAALAPAREVEYGFAQRLRGDGASMYGYAADPPALFDDQDGLAELGGLDGAAPASRAAADDDEVVLCHAAAP